MGGGVFFFLGGGGDFFSEEPLFFLGSRTIWKGIREDKGRDRIICIVRAVRTALEDTSQKKPMPVAREKAATATATYTHTHTHQPELPIHICQKVSRGCVDLRARSCTLSQQNTSPVRRLYPWRGWRCSIAATIALAYLAYSRHACWSLFRDGNHFM